MLRYVCVILLVLDFRHSKDKFLLPNDHPRVRACLEKMQQDRQEKMEKQDGVHDKSQSWTGLHMTVAEKRCLSLQILDWAATGTSIALLLLLLLLLILYSTTTTTTPTCTSTLTSTMTMSTTTTTTTTTTAPPPTTTTTTTAPPPTTTTTTTTTTTAMDDYGHGYYYSECCCCCCSPARLFRTGQDTQEKQRRGPTSSNAAA